ncbi:MAG: radical SAM protein [Firmicutes bacterium]|nr:radical SAM protein [Bacillota bacterium]
MELLPLDVKTAVNRVERMPFRWSLNPYRGCTHSCIYCYARVTHEYLGLNAGTDFNHRVFYKRNVVEALRAQLRSRSWRGEPVALGTATDVYQPAEGRLRLTRQILETMMEYGNAVTITTKSPLVLRDLDLLKQLAEGPGVTVYLSVGTVDTDAWRFLEPGTPPPKYRLRALEHLRREGIRAGVLMAPIVPRINDAPAQLEATVRAAAAAGAAFLAPSVLRLPHGAREWFLERVAAERPKLAPFYREFYKGDTSPPAYVRAVETRVRRLREKYGIPESSAEAGRPAAAAAQGAGRAALQLSLPL